MANGDGSALDRWSRLVTQLGLPTVIAGVLLWFLLSRLIGILDMMVVDLRAQTKAIEMIQKHIERNTKP